MPYSNSNKIKFCEAQRLFSAARMCKYIHACKSNEQLAVELYSYNAQLSQAFFGVISLFEVVLRNAINEHYLKTLGENWIVNQAGIGGLLEHEAEDIALTKKIYDKEGCYSHDKMVGSFTFGFWTYLFTKRNYKIGGKTLLQIFPKRAKGTTQKIAYNDITAIREFRNRIAHHEPICFDANGTISTDYMYAHYNLIRTYLQYMAVDVNQIETLIIQPEEWLMKVQQIGENIKNMNPEVC